ncbi:MAG: PTS glucitol/sorbitol transporter subunit IIA [[Pasteurella] mairii]|uniref:Glucitol/sorbitol-specific phosphotransferase enzyme IIA component n=1 Tax=[Pasteurella] mairii TaxID=757 RepID=A0A379B7E4_9PAST|nr:PTS glucitol/sorbitol transporter subunit IIA [[Pasteurella] mairii]SUB34553.1 glucitol/sorbitol-specific phosphotransferase enzyme IIA component [[Pasteurella] mairii]
MTIIYETEFTKVGDFARDALTENMLIIFKQGAPADLEDYCFIHSHGELTTALQVGDIAEFDGVAYPITAIGDVASVNLKELGHVTWRFDGATTAEYPGTIHILGEIPSAVKENSVLKIKRVEL